MPNRSTFVAPNYTPDTFTELLDLPASEFANAKRYQELKAKTNKTQAEIDEMNQLAIRLQDYLITPERWNKFQDALVNMQWFIKDNVEGYIDQKQTEMQNYVDTKKDEILTYTDTKKNEMTTYVEQKKTDVTDYVNLKKSEIEITATNSINEMTSKKDYFIKYVNTKEDEVRTLVQDFDSNTARYYQVWTATAGQLEFNIYDPNAANKSIPPEANLNITEENIDFIVNGVSMTPYTDFVIKNNGRFDTIVLNGNNAGLVGAGTEVVAKWFKNVGKLYFHHASTHGEGGSDPLIVTEGMLDAHLKEKIPSHKITVGTTPPTSPAFYSIWIDTN